MTWLDEYANWAGECTDAPAVFHRWAGYMALADVLRGRVTFNFGPRKVAPNLYVLLLGRGPAFRKSTALHLSRRIAGQAGARGLCPGADAAALIAGLAAGPDVTFYYPEAFSPAAPVRGADSAAVQTVLTALYDGPSAYTLQRGARLIPLETPCVSVFGVAEAEAVAARLQRRDLGAGLLTRFVLVKATAKEKDLSAPPPPDPDVEKRLLTELEKRANLPAVNLDLEPIRYPYAEWIWSFARTPRGPVASAFGDRLQLTCLKLAVLEAVAEDASEPHLSPAALDRAIAAVERVADGLDALEMDGLSLTDERDRWRVARVVSSVGDIHWAQLMRRAHLPRARLFQAAQALAESGFLKVSSERRPGGGHPLHVISWQGAEYDPHSCPISSQGSRQGSHAS